MLPVSKRSLPWIARAWIGLVVPRELREEIEGDLRERRAEVEAERGHLEARRWLLWQVLTLNPIGLRRDGAEGGGLDPTGGFSGAGWEVDIRQALRALRARPAMTLSVIGTVALAIGATSAVYSVVHAVLLRPLPYPEPERLMRVWQTKGDWYDSPVEQLREFASRFPLSVPTYNDWLDANTGFAALGAHSFATFVLQGAEGAEVIRGEVATSGLFEALGVPAFRGRTLSPADDAPGAPRVAVLSHGFWQERFASDETTIGSDIVLDDTPHTVVGVMPPGFATPAGRASLWTPLSPDQKNDERDSQWLGVIGRLQDGVSRDVAGQRLAAVQEGLAGTYPDEQGDVGSRVESLLDSVVGGVRSTLWFLLGAVGLVLAVATVNIANILGVSGMVRGRELAVRAALGAGRGRLVRGLLLESTLLASVGGLCGVLLTWGSLPLLTRLIPATVPRRELIEMSPGVVLFGLGLTALTAIVVGTLPALLGARAQPQEVMRQSGRGLTLGRLGGRLRSGLVVAEVSLAFVLAVGAGLLGHSFARLWSVDRGFSAEGLVSMRVVPDPAAYPERDDRDRFVRELRDAFEAIPGTQATATNQVPMSGSTSTTTYHVERPEGEPEEVNVIISVGLENFHDVLEIPLVAGRTFQPADTRDAPPVAIVNETMARELWPGERALGKQLRSDDEAPWIEVVGVVADVKHRRLDEEVEPKLYIPASQSGRAVFQWALRTRGDLQTMIDAAREAVGALSRTTPVRDLTILEDNIARTVAVPRFRTIFVVGLAGLAAAFALLGVFGALMFSVSQRTREIGVRMSLGARSGTVVRHVVGSGLRLTGLGILFGLIISWRLADLVGEFLFELTPLDPATYATVALSVLAVSAAASYVPARKAARVDPVRVLNSD